MAKYTNTANVPLPLAVWLTFSDYDFVGGKNKISATTLLKSTRQIIMANRVPVLERDHDISDFIASRMGSAFHDSIEYSWVMGHKQALRDLGYPQKVIDAIRINPDEPEKGTIPVHMEKRAERMLGDWTISGKFDMVIEGQLYDTKSTSVYSYILGSKDDHYRLQGSIYKWLNTNIITSDSIQIQLIFTDWQRSAARQQPDRYPQSRLMNYTLELLPLEETEKFIKNKLNSLEKYWNAPDSEIPYCTDEELWRSDPVYKYYSNPENTSGKATKNFTEKSEAYKHMAEKGKGVVIEFKSEPKACEYCAGFKACQQKDEYFDAGFK